MTFVIRSRLRAPRTAVQAGPNDQAERGRSDASVPFVESWSTKWPSSSAVNRVGSSHILLEESARLGWTASVVSSPFAGSTPRPS